MSTMSDFINSGPSSDTETKILQYMPNINRIINGKMDIAQRGTSVTSATSGTFLVDRYQHTVVTTGAISINQQLDGPSGFKNSLRVTVTTADTSLAADEFVGINQVIEGYNIADLVGKTFTISFWVKSSKTGVHCMFLRNINHTMSYVAELTINVANTWEFKTFTVVGGIPSNGTWNFTNLAGLNIYWVMSSGGSITSTKNTWLSGAFICTPSQVNCMDTIGNIFAITGVQLEAGEIATPFEYRLYGHEMILCQRYFQIVSLAAYRHFSADGSTSGFMSLPLPVKMRTAPSWSQTGGVSVRSPTAVTVAATISSNSAQDDCILVSIQYPSTPSITVGCAALVSGANPISVIAEL